jgi:predicted RND superfamily exporter protein
MLYYWGLTLNAFSMTFIIISIGIAVDYNAHIAHAFKTVTGTRNERVIKAFDTMGVSVFHGAMSTFLAIAVLINTKSYSMKLFFKSFFGIVVFGFSHGFILLPVILSLIGVANKGLPSLSEVSTAESPRERFTSVKSTKVMSLTGGSVILFEHPVRTHKQDHLDDIDADASTDRHTDRQLKSMPVEDLDCPERNQDNNYSQIS